MEPFIELVEKGPQMSTCIKSKGEQVIDVLCAKGNLCCFARGKMVQTLVESHGI